MNKKEESQAVDSAENKKKGDLYQKDFRCRFRLLLLIPSIAVYILLFFLSDGVKDIIKFKDYGVLASVIVGNFACAITAVSIFAVFDKSGKLLDASNRIFFIDAITLAMSNLIFSLLFYSRAKQALFFIVLISCYHTFIIFHYYLKVMFDEIGVKNRWKYEDKREELYKELKELNKEPEELSEEGKSKREQRIKCVNERIEECNKRIAKPKSTKKQTRIEELEKLIELKELNKELEELNKELEELNKEKEKSENEERIKSVNERIKIVEKRIKELKKLIEDRKESESGQESKKADNQDESQKQCCLRIKLIVRKYILTNTLIDAIVIFVPTILLFCLKRSYDSCIQTQRVWFFVIFWAYILFCIMTKELLECKLDGTDKNDNNDSATGEKNDSETGEKDNNKIDKNNDGETNENTLP
ncbi:MAG: hypothetical protein FWD49_04055 [Firmicutes bacterium]|nr:hypothetical protein [Bacillota bacterium]